MAGPREFLFLYGTLRADLRDKAELLQDRGAKLVRSAGKVFLLFVPVIVVLIIYVSWLLSRVDH